MGKLNSSSAGHDTAPTTDTQRPQSSEDASATTGGRSHPQRQFYIGTKQIKAWPEEKDGRPGYAVVYPDGYQSWSPADVFESAYMPQGLDPTRVTAAMVDAFIEQHSTFRMGTHTVVHVKLRNGFTLIEESACVDPANYDERLGTELALEKARKRVWHLLGFMLASARNGVTPESEAPGRPDGAGGL